MGDSERIKLTSDDTEIDEALEGIFDNKTEVVSFEVDKEMCNLERKGKLVEIMSKKIEKKVNEAAVKDSSALKTIKTKEVEKVEIVPQVTERFDTVVAGKELQKSGKIKMIIHSGCDLMKTDLIGKPDPYVLVEYKGAKFKSEPVKNTQTPEWNFETEIDISEEPEKVKISVLDKDIGKDDLMGNVYLCTEKMAEEDIIKESRDLENCKSGKIMISTYFKILDETINEKQALSAVDNKPYPAENKKEERLGADYDNLVATGSRLSPDGNDKYDCMKISDESQVVESNLYTDEKEEGESNTTDIKTEVLSIENEKEENIRPDNEDTKKKV